MSEHPEPEFIERTKHPERFPFIENRDEQGNVVSLSTHRMAAEVDEQGNWFAFPTIVGLPDGSLLPFQDSRKAFRFNMRIGNFKEFGKDKDAALEYARGGYKTKAMRDFDPLNFKGRIGSE